MEPAPFHHIPVLPTAVLAGLAPRPGGRYIDGTLGGGGHARAVLDASAPDGELLGIDLDPAALAAAAVRLADVGARFRAVRGNFRDLVAHAASVGWQQVDGILLDVGVSSHQLDTAERGFSFNTDAPLDMRLDPDGETSAADLVNGLAEQDLADLIYRYGEEHASRRIARFLVDARRRAPIETTGALAAVVSHAMGGRRGRLHPATRTFQALRIAVNGELESLEHVLPDAIGLLVSGGRLAVIAFHSLEDRIVKQTFRAARVAGEVKILTPKPVEADAAETQDNPRSRSAKLRVIEKIDPAMHTDTEDDDGD